MRTDWSKSAAAGRRPLVPIVLVVLLIAGCGERLPEGVDLSTPQGAARAFFETLAAGDADGAAACVVREDVQRNLAWRLADLVRAGVAAEDLTTLPLATPARLEAAEVKVEAGEAHLLLPAAGAGVAGESGARAADPAEVPAGDGLADPTEQVYGGPAGEDQAARVRDVDRPQVVVLRRSGGLWRVDLLATTGLAEQEAEEYAQRLAAAAATLRELGR